MTFRRYVFTVVLPNLIFCKLVGIPAVKIERVARKVRLSCASRMRRVMMDAPPRENADS